MIHPDTLPIDVEEMREWLNGYKVMHRLSWADLGKETDLPAGTLQPWTKGNYAGDVDRIAREIFKFRQAVQSRQDSRQGIPVEPGYFETPTSLRIRGMLAMAATGEITVCAMGSGLGKTMTALDFKERTRPVWMVTLDEATHSTHAVIQAVDIAIGATDKFAWSHVASREIGEKLRGKRGTLIVDEANHASFGALEQLRAWHDRTGVGICLMGNEELLARIESGRRRHAFARLNSRIFQKLVQNLPQEDDVAAFCDAWQISDPGIRLLLTDIAMRPGSGALRECRQIIKAATMIAADDGDRLELAHVKWAVDSRKMEIIR